MGFGDSRRPDYIHWNATGIQIAAKLIKDKIIEDFEQSNVQHK